MESMYFVSLCVRFTLCFCFDSAIAFSLNCVCVCVKD